MEKEQQLLLDFLISNNLVHLSQRSRKGPEHILSLRVILRLMLQRSFCHLLWLVHHLPGRRGAVDNFLNENQLIKRRYPDGYICLLDGTPFMLPTDATNAGDLGGKTLILVPEPPPKSRVYMRKTSGGYKSTGKFFGSSGDDTASGASDTVSQRSTAGSSVTVRRHHSDVKSSFGLKLNPKWWSLFGSKIDTASMEQLTTLLNDFLNNGMPTLENYTPPEMSAECLAGLVQIQQFELDTGHLHFLEIQRQAVIRELLVSEAIYIQHLRTVAEIFIAVGLSLQKSGVMVEVDFRRLFANLPEILNANLEFWNTALYPMMENTVFENKYNSQLMLEGFLRFPEIFAPYEYYMSRQEDITNYCRRLMNDSPIYCAFIAWCESSKQCNRLKLTDILVMPMQRLTKYSLLINALWVRTHYEPEKSSLYIMWRRAESFVRDVNAKIRHNQEYDRTLELLEKMENYDAVDVRDEELEKILKRHLHLHLEAPIVGCLRNQPRTVLFEGDIKFKDSKDQRLEARAILFIDLLLICVIVKRKKMITYKVVRPKYMLDNLVVYPQTQPREGREGRDITALHCVIVDDAGTAVNAFTIMESNLATSLKRTLRAWDHALKEAKLTLEYSRQVCKNPHFGLQDRDTEPMPETRRLEKQGSEAERTDEWNGDRNARSRVMMLLRTISRVSTEADATTEEPTPGCSYWSDQPQRLPTAASTSAAYPRLATKSDSSRASRVSSLQQSYSGSYDINESVSSGGPIMNSHATSAHPYPSGIGEVHPGTSISSDEGGPSSTDQRYTTNTSTAEHDIRRDSTRRTYSRALTPTNFETIQVPQRSTPNTLTVQHTTTLGQSMPNLHSALISPSIPRYKPVGLSVPAAQSNQKQLLKPVQKMKKQSELTPQLLSPHQRGISYPPPSPTRGSLRRGFAFSTTIKNPPLVKTRHVTSQSTVPPAPVPAPTEDKPKKTSEQSKIKKSTQSAAAAVNMALINNRAQKWSHPQSSSKDSRQDST